MINRKDGSSKIISDSTLPTRSYSTKQEKRIAKEMGGKRVSNSGAASFVGGDVTTNNFLIECKTAKARKKSMSIQEEWILKIQEEAIGSRKEFWALFFNFGGLENDEDYVILDKATFYTLVEAYSEER